MRELREEKWAEHTAQRNAALDIYCGGWYDCLSLLPGVCPSKSSESSHTVQRLSTVVDEQHSHIFDILPLYAYLQGVCGIWEREGVEGFD